MTRPCYKLMSAEERFFARMTKDGPVHLKYGKCWQWLGVPSAGYGELFVNSRGCKAHRYSWILHYGDIPDGLFVLHKCDNKLCVNPKHLFVGTQKDNVQDCLSKGRHRCGNLKGEESGNAVLTNQDILEIRSRHKKRSKGPDNGRSLAREYGVSEGHISEIVNYKSWRHI